ERARLGRLVTAVAPLAARSQPFDPLIADCHALRPPRADLELRRHERGDVAVRHLVGMMVVERADPLLPRASGFRLHAGVAHAGERRVVLWRWFALRLLDDLRAGGGVRFTRFEHPSANEALEILVARHRRVSLGTPRATPQQCANGGRKGSDDSDPEVCPPLPRTGPRLGRSLQEVRRGSAPATQCEPLPPASSRLLVARRPSPVAGSRTPPRRESFEMAWLEWPSDHRCHNARVRARGERNERFNRLI